MLGRPRRRLGEVLRLDNDLVDLVATDRYPIAGVYGFGRGVFGREPITGADTSYSKLNRLRTGQVVMSRLKAFEGAIAVVPEEFDGYFVSTEFPTFTCVAGELDSRYAAHLCRWHVFWVKLAASSKGIGSRRERVHARDLLTLELNLPPIGEQQRQADVLDELLEAALHVDSALRGQISSDFCTALPAFVDSVIDSVPTESTPVRDLVEFVSDTVHPGDDPSPAAEFVGLQHVESHTGRRIGSDPLGPMKGRKFRFQPGDILYGYLRPYLNKVWVADRDGLCSVDQYVLRPRAGTNPALLAHALRGRRVLDRSIELTHNLQLPRLRSGLLSAIEVPHVSGQPAADVVRRLDALRDTIGTAAALRKRQFELVDALLPSAMNAVFEPLA